MFPHLNYYRLKNIYHTEGNDQVCRYGCNGDIKMLFSFVRLDPNVTERLWAEYLVPYIFLNYSRIQVCKKTGNRTQLKGKKYIHMSGSFVLGIISLWIYVHSSFLFIYLKNQSRFQILNFNNCLILLIVLC